MTFAKMDARGEKDDADLMMTPLIHRAPSPLHPAQTHNHSMLTHTGPVTVTKKKKSEQIFHLFPHTTVIPIREL
jgi:hypothetical protein